MPNPDLQQAARQAVDETIAALTSLGRAELTNAVLALQAYAPDAARWVADRAAARVAGDQARLDQMDRNLELLAANAALELAAAGVLAQAEGERLAGTLLTMVGRFAVAAAVAA